MLRRPPRSTLFPYRRSSDLVCRRTRSRGCCQRSANSPAIRVPPAAKSCMATRTAGGFARAITPSCTASMTRANRWISRASLTAKRYTTEGANTSVRHRVDDVIDADADAEGGEPFGVLRVVRVLPGIAQIHVVTDGHHQPAVIVVDAAPVGGTAFALVLFVDFAALQVLSARHLVAVVQIEHGVEDGVLVRDVDDRGVGEDLLHALDKNPIFPTQLH